MVGLERLRFEIVTPPGERPRREDVKVYEADGSLYTGPLLSPSSYSNADRCLRIWVFDKIDRIPRVEKSYHVEGKRLHKEILEDWLIDRKPPTSRSVLDSGVLELFPPPQPGLRAEDGFVLRAWRLAEGRERAVVFWGFKDLEYEEAGQPTVRDLKTTSDLRWQKSTAELRADVQCVIYFADRLAEYPQIDEMQGRWVYMTRSKPYKCHATDVWMTRNWVLERINGFIPLAQEVQRLSQKAATLPVVEGENGAFKALGFDPRPTACNMYGGCDFLERCSDISGKQRLRSFFAQDKEAKQRKDKTKPVNRGEQEDRKMGTLEMLAKKKKDPSLESKLQEAKEKAPEKSVLSAAKQQAAQQEAEVAEGAASAVASATSGQPSGSLSALLLKARGGQPAASAGAVSTGEEASENEEKPPVRAQGINPPDARDPDEVQKSEEAPKDKTAQRLKAEDEQQGSGGGAEEEEAETEAAGGEGEQGTGGRRGRGRPPGSKNKNGSSGNKAKKTALSKAFILMIDCVPLKGLGFANVEELIAPSREEVENDAETDYRLIQYNEGPKMLSVQLKHDLEKLELKGAYHVSSKTTEREVLDALMRRADVVVKGGF